MIRVEIEGVNELKEALDGVKRDFFRALAASLIAGTFVVSNAAKTDAPYLTGNLMRSIHTEIDGGGYVTRKQQTDNASQPVEMGAVDRLAAMLESGEVKLEVGTDVIYAAVQEFLHDTPYLRPALDNNKQEVKAEISRAMKQVIAKAGR